MKQNDITAVLDVLTHGNQLKRTPRTGWVQRGVPAAENVAAHSYGVVFTALILAQCIKMPLNLEIVLIMAALHDLPEGLTTDIPTPAWKFLPPDIKSSVERGAMETILQNVDFAPELMTAWETLHAAETAESHLVHDADKLDLFIQARVYEQQTGNRQLEEFWTKPHQFYFSEAQALYDWLREQRSL